MSSTSAGTSFIALLSRLVLAVGFFFSGWHLCFGTVEFTPEEIRVLEGDAVAITPVSLLASTAQKPTSQPTAKGTNATKPPSVQAAALAAMSKTTEQESPAEAPAASKSGHRPAAMTIALRLREVGFENWSQPTAWAASVAELIGGVAIFIGLLTRFWAFVMAVMLGTSFWLSTIQAEGMFDRNPFEWAADAPAFEQMLFAAGLFVLAVGLLIKGSGPLALDRLLWPSHAKTATSRKNLAVEDAP